MRRATTAPDALASDPDSDAEPHTNAPEHEEEGSRHDSAELNESVGRVEVIKAEHQREGREEREQYQ